MSEATLLDEAATGGMWPPLRLLSALPASGHSTETALPACGQSTETALPSCTRPPLRLPCLHAATTETAGLPAGCASALRFGTPSAGMALTPLARPPRYAQVSQLRPFCICPWALLYAVPTAISSSHVMFALSHFQYYKYTMTTFWLQYGCTSCSRDRLLTLQNSK
jgi:hypothetical protein